LWKTDLKPFSATVLDSSHDPVRNRARRLSALAVDIATVAEGQDQHQKPVIMYLIEHPVGANAEAEESRKTLERLDAGWSWLLR
jgi:hypothetical protein